MQTVTVKHNFEMAHRLQLPGKCQNIHGHSWMCMVEVFGDPDAKGIIIDFHELKGWLVPWLDEYFDHRLMLWKDDPFVELSGYDGATIPGLVAVPFDPTTENISKYIGQQVRKEFGLDYRYRVVLEEGFKNGASWEG